MFLSKCFLQNIFKMFDAFYKCKCFLDIFKNVSIDSGSIKMFSSKYLFKMFDASYKCKCFLDIFKMFLSKCFLQNIFTMFHAFFANVFWIFLKCFYRNVFFKTFPQCFTPVMKMFPGCFLDVSIKCFLENMSTIFIKCYENVLCLLGTYHTYKVHPTDRAFRNKKKQTSLQFLFQKCFCSCFFPIPQNPRGYIFLLKQKKGP